MAQIRQYCDPQLQYFLSHKFWLRAKPSLSRPFSEQYFGSIAGNSPTAREHSYFANCPRFSRSNRNDVRKNAMQAYILYKAYYDKKAKVSMLKEADYVYVLQPKVHHQGRKIPFTNFWWIGPYIIEKMLPNNNYLVRKIGTNKTQVFHRMRMRQFTPRQSPADIRIKPQENQPDPDVSLKHDDLYARAWEIMNSQFLKPKTTMQRHPIYTKVQYSLIFQLGK